MSSPLSDDESTIKWCTFCAKILPQKYYSHETVGFCSGKQKPYTALYHSECWEKSENGTKQDPDRFKTECPVCHKKVRSTDMRRAPKRGGVLTFRPYEADDDGIKLCMECYLSYDKVEGKLINLSKEERKRMEVAKETPSGVK